MTNAGRLTGLLAGYAILVVLALMARVPALERGVGSDRLARWHAAGGRYVVSLALAHTLLIIWGYAVTAHADVVSQTTTLVLTYPDVLMATVAVGLLVLVGVTSARAARKRLRYETWHLLHLYTYLAIALTFAHEFRTGADFTDVRVRVLWLGLYVMVGATLLWYRVLTPLINYARHTLRVVAVVAHGPAAVSVIVGGRNLARLRARPGQFFRWRFLTRDLAGAANPYSLSATPYGDQLRITVRTAGTHSAALARLRPGTRVLAEGPYGAFTADVEHRSALGRRSGKVLLIGVGIGITPVRALLESAPAAPGGITVLYRARSAGDLVLRDEIDHLAAVRGARVHYLLGRREEGDHLSPQQLRRLVPDLAAHEVYLCGPDELVATLARDLRRAGVARAGIHFESFVF
ncbi:ferric reductase-like transmembrane domain-containing protein [uncultured Jatrophihabitans sp.]|uniref:ferredoxin reductase family protein n=1 Tax=uncultured Jatrophihabitans sp. TaxID=1610747 RepID=UPI0035CAEAF3